MPTRLPYAHAHARACTPTPPANTCACRAQMAGGSQFIVKQISRSEKQTLMGLLPDYEEYVTRRNGRSLI
eukprot:7222246-Prymnesium_polylepis.1